MGVKLELSQGGTDILEVLQLEKAQVVAQITQKLVFLRVCFLLLTVSTMLIVSLEVVCIHAVQFSSKRIGLWPTKRLSLACSRSVSLHMSCDCLDAVLEGLQRCPQQGSRRGR